MYHALNHGFLTTTVYKIRNLRIQRAKELLQTGECSVTEASIASGFNDTSYFSREFKKVLGFSPKEYRDQNLNQEDMSFVFSDIATTKKPSLVLGPSSARALYEACV